MMLSMVDYVFFCSFIFSLSYKVRLINCRRTGVNGQSIDVADAPAWSARIHAAHRAVPARAARTRCAAHTPARVLRCTHAPASRARAGLCFLLFGRRCFVLVKRQSRIDRGEFRQYVYVGVTKRLEHSQGAVPTSKLNWGPAQPKQRTRPETGPRWRRRAAPRAAPSSPAPPAALPAHANTLLARSRVQTTQPRHLHTAAPTTNSLALTTSRDLPPIPSRPHTAPPLPTTTHQKKTLANLCT